MKKISAKQIEGGGGVGGGNQLFTKTHNLVGLVGDVTGTTRWYPSTDVILTSVFLNIGVRNEADAIGVNIKKNGEPLFSISLPANAFKSDILTLSNLPILTTDYLTIDVAATGGYDMTVNITYLQV